MVLSTWLEDELKKRRQRQIEAAVESAVEAAVEAAVEKTRAEATAEVHGKWNKWNRRREAAVAAGEDFDEPPPDIDVIENESTQRDE